MDQQLDENWCREIYRNSFLKHMKNAKSQPKHRFNCSSKITPTCQRNHSDCLSEIPAQEMKTKQKEYELGSNLQDKLPRHQATTITSGGDADRVLNVPLYNSQQCSEPYRQRNIGDNYSLKQLHCNPKIPTPAMPLNENCHSSKYQSTTVPLNECAEHRRRYEIDSNLNDFVNDSEGSVKSQKSSKTVVSRKSAHDLQKIVKSQCKLHEEIQDAIKQFQSTDLDANIDDNPCGFNEQLYTQYPLTINQCKRCSDCVHPRQSQRNVTTEIGKDDFLDCRNTDTLTISVDDVVNSKVINPMIRKLQRMYLNIHKEEMSLMEDLESLPYKVNEVYKATILKQKDQ